MWEFVGRPAWENDEIEDIQKNPGGVDVVGTAVNPTTGVKQMLFIKIFWIPVNKYMIEWPAGFIDEGESGLEAGIWELKEEAGYTGTPIWESKSHYTDEWKSSDSGKLVFVDINLTHPAN